MSRVSSARSFLAGALILLTVAACSSSKKDTYVERPIDQLYNKAMDQLDKGNYESASKAFDEVDQQHPNSTWATKAQLMSAYALYKGGKQDEAVVALDRFIQLHPAYKDTPYAYYLKGLCYYEQIADVQRDQKITEQAMAALQEVVTRYPDSKYGHDARFKLDLVRDQLAGKDLAIGRFYEARHQYLAAINRYRNVVEKYQTTTQLPEALHRLTECYLALGLVDEAKKTAAVLGYNYPGSPWYQDSYDMVKDAQPAAVMASAKAEKPEQAAPAADGAAAKPDSGSGWLDWIPWPF
jgi:outer membrane protein assembly factor BamD